VFLFRVFHGVDVLEGLENLDGVDIAGSRQSSRQTYCEEA